MLQTPALKPRLTQARAELTRQISVVNEFGETSQVHIPAERALTVYLDKKELVTLMTLGASPEWLVLGFLLNQRLIQSVNEIESITVDWILGEAKRGLKRQRASSRQAVDKAVCSEIWSATLMPFNCQLMRIFLRLLCTPW
jgi:formate dehydrogenase assembly factor FdhD